MKLQLALDFKDEKDALDAARKAGEFVDILEAGTPLIKSAGIQIVTKLKEMFPNKIILADLKTMDVGKFEADFAFEAGADIVTVCGAADDGTVAGAIESANNHGKKAMVDLINIADKPARAKQIQELGAHYIGVHSGIDQQMKGMNPLQDLKEVSEAVDIPIIVAGGINLDTVSQIAAVKPEVVVVGGAITKSAEPGEMAKQIKEKLE